MASEHDDAHFPDSSSGSWFPYVGLFGVVMALASVPWLWGRISLGQFLPALGAGVLIGGAVGLLGWGRPKITRARVGLTDMAALLGLFGPTFVVLALIAREAAATYIMSYLGGLLIAVRIHDRSARRK